MPNKNIYIKRTFYNIFVPFLHTNIYKRKKKILSLREMIDASSDTEDHCRSHQLAQLKNVYAY